MKFSDLLQELGVPFKQAGEGGHTREGWINFACPFCGGGKHRDSMGYNLAGNYVNCYRCGKKTVKECIAEIAGISYTKAGKMLDGLETVRVEVVDKRGTLVLPKGVKPMLKQHRRYLRSRGFDPDQIESMWGVQGIGIAPKLQWRLFIPIYDQHGKMVSWTTRTISDDPDVPRYRSAAAEQEELNHKELLYGEDKATHAICVVEGPVGCWAIGPGTVGTCGVGYTRAQLLRMSRYRNIGVCFDPEPEAQKRARTLVNDLAAFGGNVFNIVLEDSEDPGAITKKERRQIRDNLQLA